MNDLLRYKIQGFVLLLSRNMSLAGLIMVILDSIKISLDRKSVV